MEYTSIPETAPAIRLLEDEHAELNDEERRNGELWARIFKKPTWLRAALSSGANPVLIGKDVASRGGDIYLALVSLDWTGDLYAHADGRTLRDCLQDHEWNEDLREATITGTGITVNLWEWFAGHDHTRVPDLLKVFSVLEDGYETAMLYLAGQPRWDVTTAEVTLDKQGNHRFQLLCDQYLYLGKPVSWILIGSGGSSSSLNKRVVEGGTGGFGELA